MRAKEIYCTFRGSNKIRKELVNRSAHYKLNQNVYVPVTTFILDNHGKFFSNRLPLYRQMINSGTKVVH